MLEDADTGAEKFLASLCLNSTPTTVNSYVFPSSKEGIFLSHIECSASLASTVRRITRLIEQSTVGVDVGGTFSDFVIWNPSWSLHVHKRLSTPQDPSESLLSGLTARGMDSIIGINPVVLHGTTVATNALLERKGCKTALLVTRGFRDILEIGRQNRANLYSFTPTRTRPLLDRQDCFEVTERLDWRGEVVTPLDVPSMLKLLNTLKAENYESLAICTLFGYLNPLHEEQIGDIARQKGFFVSLASEIAPEPREFERASTTVANAFVAPVMGKYLARLEQQLNERNISHLRVMQSNGGTLHAKEAGEQAIKTVLSGPAGGVVASMQIGRACGYSDLLTFDMGGTSTDVALIVDGECPIVTNTVLNGIPLRTPMLDIHTVGAGGGSLARRDRAGGVRVGPESAGADPGPIAYGKGERLTVTDANLLLGRLPAETRLAGSMALQRDRVRDFGSGFARECGLGLESLAQGVLDVANSTMIRALRHISLERGYDPSRFTLLSFGGAGGLHACDLAHALSMETILVPRYPGAFSALGLVLADVRREFAFPLPPTGDLSKYPTQGVLLLEVPVRHLQQQAGIAMQKEGVSKWRATLLLEMRYVGQSFSLRVPLASSSKWEQSLRAFHRAHKARYGHSDPKEPVEIIGVRLVAIASLARPKLEFALPANPGKPIGNTTVYWHGKWQDAPLFLREHLAFEQILPSPAIVIQPDATTFVAPGWVAKVALTGDIILKPKSA